MVHVTFELPADERARYDRGTRWLDEGRLHRKGEKLGVSNGTMFMSHAINLRLWSFLTPVRSSGAIIPRFIPRFAEHSFVAGHWTICSRHRCAPLQTGRSKLGVACVPARQQAVGK